MHALPRSFQTLVRETLLPKGREIPPFELESCEEEYSQADKEKKQETVLGRFILAALAHKSMVTNRIYKSGNLLAGYSVDYKEEGFRGIQDFKLLLEQFKRGKES